MIRQDVLITEDDRDGPTKGWWTFFVCSNKGVVALVTAGGDHAQPLEGGALAPVYLWRTDDISRAKNVYERLLDMNAADEINAWMVEGIPYMVVAFNAEQMTRKSAADDFEARIADHFMPLLDAAIEAKNKTEITQLFNQFPHCVGKSFVADRLRQTFPELRKEGVTLQNWYKNWYKDEA